MKIRRFSELDLARFISFARDGRLEPALRRYDAGGGSWSYEPVRASTSDIVGASTPLYGPLVPVTWSQIEWQIRAACKHGQIQVAANLEVGEVLFDACRGLSWRAAKVPMGRLPIGAGESVRFWSDVALANDDGTFVPFLDHRRDNGAESKEVQAVIFSMQHVWVRERNPDLAEARLAIIRFSKDSPRKMLVEFQCDEKLLSYEELDARVRLVYEAWSRILRERAPARRKTGTDGTADLFEED